MPFFADSGPLCELTTLRTNRFAFFFIQLMFWISFCFFVFAAPLCYTLFFVQEFHLLSLMPRQLLALLLPSWLSLCFALVFCFCFCVLFFFSISGSVRRQRVELFSSESVAASNLQHRPLATCNLQLPQLRVHYAALFAALFRPPCRCCCCRCCFCWCGIPIANAIPMPQSVQSQLPSGLRSTVCPFDQTQTHKLHLSVCCRFHK